MYYGSCYAVFNKCLEMRRAIGQLRSEINEIKFRKETALCVASDLPGSAEADESFFKIICLKI
jgi:hypothetical protein